MVASRRFSNKGLARELMRGNLDAHVSRVIAHGERPPYGLTRELVVRFQDDVKRAEAERLAASVGLRIVRELRHAGNTFVLEGEGPPSYELLNAADTLAQSGRVVYVEPNLVCAVERDAYTPNDPLFGQVPHLQLISADDAWDLLDDVAVDLRGGSPAPVRLNRLFCAIHSQKGTAMSLLKALLTIVALTLATAACDGPVGPQGDRGPEGPQGQEGEQGPRGPAGEHGNANVQVYERDISDMTWTVSSSNDYSYLDIPAPNVLTQATLETSTILVYVRTSDFSGWGIVPYYTERGIRVTATITVGNVRLKKDQNGNPSTQSWHDRIRIVVIENSSTDPLPLNVRGENGGVSATAINMADYPASAVRTLQ